MKTKGKKGKKKMEKAKTDVADTSGNRLPQMFPNLVGILFLVISLLLASTADLTASSSKEDLTKDNNILLDQALKDTTTTLASENVATTLATENIAANESSGSSTTTTTTNNTNQTETVSAQGYSWPAVTPVPEGGSHWRHLNLRFTPTAGTDARDWEEFSSTPKKLHYPLGLGVQHCYDELPFFFRLWPTPIALYEKVSPAQSWNKKLAHFFSLRRNETAHLRKNRRDIFGASNGWKSSATALPVENFKHFLSISWANRQAALPAVESDPHEVECDQENNNCEASLSPSPTEPTLTTANTSLTTHQEDPAANAILIENTLTVILQHAERAITDSFSSNRENVSVRIIDGWVVIDDPGHFQNPRSNHHQNHISPRHHTGIPSEVRNETLEVTTDWTLVYVIQNNGKVSNQELILNDPRIAGTVLERGVYDTYDQRLYLHDASMILFPANIPYSVYVNYGNQSRILLTLLIQSKYRVEARPLDRCYGCPTPPTSAVASDPPTSVVASEYGKNSNPTQKEAEQVKEDDPTQKEEAEKVKEEKVPEDNSSPFDSSLPPDLTSNVIVNGEQLAIPTKKRRAHPKGALLYHWHRWHTGVLQYGLPSHLRDPINWCLANYSLDLMALGEGIYLSNYGGYHSKTDIWEEGSVAPGWAQKCLNVVRDYAYHAVASYLQHSMYPVADVYPKIESDQIAWQIDITNAWINVNGKSHFNVPHIHPGTVVSGVYYIDDGGDDCSSLYFDNPMHAPIHQFQYLGQDLDRDMEKGYMDDNDIAIHSVPGTFLVFPSWAEHYTLPHHCPSNETEDVQFRKSTSTSTTGCRRMSIAFNVYVEKNKYGNTWCDTHELPSRWCVIYPVRHTVSGA